MEAITPRHDFVSLEKTAYLNQAALGLIPAQSLQAMVDHLVQTAQHGNVWLTDEDEMRILDGLRAEGARLLGTSSDAVAVLGGASQGLTAAVAMMPAGDVVLVDTDFPSVTHPWLAGGGSDRTVVWVSDEAGVNLTERLVDAVRPGTAAVCVSAVMYATGTQIDCSAIAQRAHEVGARLIVDATQIAGVGPVDQRAWDADVIVTSGYKWLCAHGGAALLALGDDLLDSVPPQPGWMGTANPFAFDALHRDQAPGARRYEQSTIAYASAIGLTTSINRWNDLGSATIAAHTRALAQELITAAEPLGWRPFRQLDDPCASGQIVALRHQSLDASTTRAALHRDHNIVTSARLGALRVSMHAFNDSADIARLTAALHALDP
jgi:selenocysteine lyase/cysteine desulfurase